jgi:hypothetical protein
MRLIPLDSTRRVVELPGPAQLGLKKAHAEPGAASSCRAAYVEPDDAASAARVTCLTSAGVLRCCGPRRR